MSFIAKELRQERFKLINDAQDRLRREKASAEANAAFDIAMVEADTMLAKAEREEKAENLKSQIDQIIGQQAEYRHVSVGQVENSVERFKRGFLAQMRHGAHMSLSPEDRVLLAEFQNAAGVGTGSAGGYTVQTDLMKEIYAAMILEGGVRLSRAKNIQTSQGNNLDMVMNDDTSNVATIVGENASLGTGPDLAFSKITLGAYKYTTGVQPVSKELLQDSAFDFDGFLREQITHRFARGTNAHFTAGNGTTQPQGVVTAATSGKVGVTGQTSSIIYNDLVDLEHSVAVPYRRNAQFMMSDGLFKTVKKLVDGQSRPLWLPSLSANAPDSLLGYDIVINADMAAPAANAKPLLFGDFSQFVIRDVLDLNIQVLYEVLASNGQIGLVGTMRADSKLASVGACLKYYANSAT